MRTRILVIKLSALGDFITALGPMRAIRTHHQDAHITLLTTKPFAELGRACGYFDDVVTDTKPKWHDLKGWLQLRETLQKGQFSRVYDLQNSDRSSLYFKLFKPRPEWVGIAPGASHRNTSPLRTQGRAYDGHVQTLGLAGISDISPDTLDWMTSDTSRFGVTSPYILLVPGCSPQHPLKRWPIARYRQAAEAMISRNYQVVMIGGPAEAETNAQIAKDLPVLNLTRQTDLYDIAGLARNAAGGIGNDTGPSHIAALTGCKMVVLYCNKASTIRKHGPLGACAKAIEVDDLAALSADQVVEALSELIKV
jgi:ADP-heptose:LPS heptosyltransferase